MSKLFRFGFKDKPVFDFLRSDIQENQTANDHSKTTWLQKDPVQITLLEQEVTSDKTNSLISTY